ncbi:MAG: carboxypeptidase regulatory-like domain-containing protein, partial [Bryobacterales bacterium]|nr:carboxypeptidase regulatory-like domain-containing protein [Bryobacterales bacterium]
MFQFASKQTRRLSFLLYLAIGLASLNAQTFAEITGTITDSTGAVVPAATVSVINSQTNQERRVESNESGNYTVPFLVPGGYSAKVQHSGFKGSVRSGIRLQVGDVARVDFVLDVGGVNEIIEVTGGAALIETDNSAVG